ncbi:MAG: hypothetical protein N2246_02160 [Candidatus Sumerlaeia bacterium]|nr:hypothetical protein [Candidatus Sumerlaeia bacterium]
MNTKSNNKLSRLLVGVIGLLLFTSINGCTKKQQKPSVEQEPMIVFPPGAVMLMSVSMAEQRTPEASKEYEEMLRKDSNLKEQIDKIKEATGMDVFKDIDHIALGLYYDAKKEESERVKVLVLGKGKFNEDKIVSLIKKESQNPVTTIKYAGMSYYTAEIDKNINGFIAFPKPQFLLFGTNKESFESCIDRFSTPLPSTLEDVALSEGLNSVNRKAPFWLAGTVPAGVLDKSSENKTTAMLKKISGYYFYVQPKPDKGSYIEFGAICGSVADAGELKKGMQDLLNQIKGFLMLIPSGEAMNILVNKALVSAEGKKAKMVIELTEKEIIEMKAKWEEMQKNLQPLTPSLSK